MKLREIAHSRTGDKGDISNVSVIAYDEKDYDYIKKHVTVAVVKDLYKDIVKGEIIRYELPNIGALNFVMKEALGGGVTKSLALDIHGKCLGSALMNLDLPNKD